MTATRPWIFGVGIAVLRVAAGLWLLGSAARLALAAPPWFTALWMAIIMIAGAFLVVGLLTRPAACIGFIAVVWVSIFAESVIAAVHGAVLPCAVMLLLGAGGAGHVWGIDGVVATSVARPKRWMRALFF